MKKLKNSQAERSNEKNEKKSKNFGSLNKDRF